jgi:hypothetical protein
MTDRSDEPTLPPVHEIDPSHLSDNDHTRAPLGDSTLQDDASVRSVSFLDSPRRSGDLGSLGTNCIEAQIGKGGMGYVFRASR